ncbi:MAG: PLDc N-terminal domain-containing protein [Bacteroidales bacterium]|nr:PLDc N-terminal domain-containing protein [Bacteroidales bacterium]
MITGTIAYIGILTMVAIAFFILFIPLIALVDILTSRFEGNDKLVWVLVVLFFPFIGALLYFAIGRQRKIG